MGSIYLAAFIVACAGSFTATPFSIWLAKRYGIWDQPTSRKVHTQPIPPWGGLGIYLGILMGVLGVYVGFPRFRVLLDYRHSVYDQGRLVDITSLDKQFAGILVGLTIVVLLGMTDDRKPVPSVYKLFSQIIASLIVLNYGVQISGLRLPFFNSYFQFPILLSQVVT